MVEDWSSNLCRGVWVFLQIGLFSVFHAWRYSTRRGKLSDKKKEAVVASRSYALVDISQAHSMRGREKEKGFEVPETRQGNETWFRTAVQKSPKRPSRLTTAHSLRFPVSLRVRSSPSTTTTFSLPTLRCSTSNVPVSLDANKCDSLPTSRRKCVRNTEDPFKYCGRIRYVIKKKPASIERG